TKGDVAFDELFQVHAAHKFHDHEILPVGEAEVVSLDDAGVNQVGHQTGFADEVFLKFGNGGVFFANELNRHGLSKVAGAELGCFVNHAHAAFCDLTDEFVVNPVGELLKH